MLCQINKLTCRLQLPTTPILVAGRYIYVYGLLKGGFNSSDKKETNHYYFKTCQLATARISTFQTIKIHFWQLFAIMSKLEIVHLLSVGINGINILVQKRNTEPHRRLLRDIKLGAEISDERRTKSYQGVLGTVRNYLFYYKST